MLASQPAPGSACARLRATCAEPPRGKNIRPMRTRFMGGTLASGRSLVSVHEHHGHGHDHAISANADRGKLRLALGLIAGFMLVEVAAGVLAGSLALLSDAAHMLTDAAAIGLALAAARPPAPPPRVPPAAAAIGLPLVAARLAARPPGGAFTFGLRRAEVLSAQVNGAALLALAVVIAVDAIRRLADPPEVEGGVVIVVGLVGAAVNVAAAAALARAERRSLNVEGARLHVMADLFGSLGAVAAGLVVVATGYDRADPIAALLVSALMLRSAWSLLREPGRVLLEAAPRGLDVDEIGRALATQPGVSEVHDLHVWEVTSGFPALAAHVMVPSGADCPAKRRELQDLLRQRFDLRHTTLQVEHEPRSPLIDIEERREPD